MSPEGKLYGPNLIDEMVATTAELQETLKSATFLPAEAAEEASRRLQKMADDLKSVRKTLFVKTQGGTELVSRCLGPVNSLRMVMEGLATGTPTDAQAQMDAALKTAEERVAVAVDKARSLVIRMT